MASVSPPKPWERAGGAPSSALPVTVPPSNTAASSNMATNTNTNMATTNPSSTSTDPPSLPSRPDNLNSVVNRTASSYSPYGGSRLGGGSPYGGGYGGGYGGSPYSSLGGMGGMGGMGSSMYGGMGRMGGMGGMGMGGMGGMGGMYGGGMGGYGMGGMGGMGGMPGQDPNDPNSLTNSFSQSTQATFQIIESIVGAFGGFAQMLESTYMATHSSFFAMVSVAEQFGALRNTLGSVLGIFTVLRWLRTLIAKVTGRPPPADATALTPSAFAAFTGKQTLPDGSPAPAKPSKKPFIMFLIAVCGLPYLMGKLIRALASSQEEEAKRQQQQQLTVGPNGEPVAQTAALDPSKLDFCRAIYDYTPEAQNTAGVDLAVKKGDLVAVLSKSDPMGNPSEWWRCRARDGSVGYLPSPYLEAIQRRPGQQAITSGSEPSSRTSTMVGTKVHDNKPQIFPAVPPNKAGIEKPAPQINGKMGDISPESFQKSTFYS